MKRGRWAVTSSKVSYAIRYTASTLSVGTSRRFVATHRLGRFWRHSGYTKSVAKVRCDATDPGCVKTRRRLEREAGRNVEVMWLTCRLVPDHKTIAEFRKDNGPAIKQVCIPFVELCRQIGLLTTASVAIDG